MKFDLARIREILAGTPDTLSTLLDGLSDDWTGSDGDMANWTPFDVVGHLIHGEQTDWIPRASIILEQGDDLTFVPFDRLAQFQSSDDKTLADLLGEFTRLRRANLDILDSFRLGEDQLSLTGIHPELGEVTLRQLLATWAVHDLNHIRQIVTSVAGKLENEVGPWRAYLSILNK